VHSSCYSIYRLGFDPDEAIFLGSQGCMSHGAVGAWLEFDRRIRGDTSLAENARDRSFRTASRLQNRHIFLMRVNARPSEVLSAIAH
jgi:hypothetical protein